MAAVVICFFFVLLASVLIVSVDAECTSSICKNIASQILASIDETVDPCSDFWSFSCSQWQDNHDIPPSQKEVTRFDDFEEELLMKLKNILETPITQDDPFYLKYSKIFYEKCLNLDDIESEDAKGLLSSFDAIGGFPLLDAKQWEANNKDANNEDGKLEKIFDIIVALYKNGHEFDGLIDITSTMDMRTVSKTMLSITQGSLHNKELMDDKYKDEYDDYMEDVLRMLGAKDDEDTLYEMIDEVLQFEIDLSKMEPTEEEMKDESTLYVVATIDELDGKYPGIPFKKLLQGIFDEKYSSIGEDAVLTNDRFFDKLPTSLKETKLRTVVNYMMWTVVKNVDYLLPKRLRDRSFEFQSFQTGQKEQNERWKVCVANANKYLPEALSVGYVNSYFGIKERENAEELVKYVRKEFYEVLERLEWIDESSKRVAEEKLNKLILAIGFPDELLNKTVMDYHYKDLEIDKNDSLFQIDRQINKWRNKKELENVNTLVELNDWTQSANVVQVNAFFKLNGNVLKVPAGLLQEAIFHIDYPAFYNFGALGFVTGHELTHGFDDRGSFIDPDSEVNEWWTMNTKVNFAEKSQCLVNQFDKFNVINSEGKRLQVNGSNTINENIADVGGLKIAFKAYQTYAKDNDLDTNETIPGLKYSFDQLFFIKFATVWCNKERDELLEHTVPRAEHSINRMRVIGSIVNNESFGKIFNCPVDSSMNPEVKCLVW